MSEIERRFRLIVDQQVGVDLARVRQEDSWAHAQIIALLQEYAAGTFPPEELIDERFESEEIENVEPLWHLQDRRLNVYRLKLVNVGRWRVLTAGDRQSREVAVLAVMHRAQNYQADRPLMDRIKKSYESLGFKPLG
ncbi:hypothetical protein GRI44_12090 [Altererythrobacter confluentis]|uniref:Uncharacterized protein n=1 Tax=Allopontixanthobacter confluentis TaxID=1849021 RepID=A0A6L7GHF9_9SPHN|nr:hypothetical protein [Allopontixanthobacter confluentis]MXP15492.1 hypothetical protein [Allopontixanthobacter confluentis]